MSNYDKLKGLLEELFQFDQADLDFGIYRIMNQKRDEITNFLDEDLLPQVRQTLQEYRDSVSNADQAELQEAIKQAQGLGIDPDSSPRVQELRAKLGPTQDVGTLEEEVFSHLYDFFRRYYSEGDFISLRRYKEGVYAIPYEGEEVKLYWANHDQYYVKSSENFRDYTFRLHDGRRVHFKIVDAETTKDNNRAANDNNRRFLLADKDPVAEEDGELVIHFVYEPDKRKQNAINATSAEMIFSATGIEAWLPGLQTLQPIEKNANRTLLDRHLDQYSKRNTFDYFIHKDLGRFLHRELDFYIKNEIMHLDDIEGETAPRVEQYLGKLRALRTVAGKLITFLAQLEDFQKRLWLKKKFVVETNYCVTLDRVPEELYPEILANEAQIEEWRQLFAIDEIGEGLFAGGGMDEEFLQANPYLVLDTAHFPQEFKNRLLQGWDGLDRETDGVVIGGDNFQVLSLLDRRWQDQVNCIHIDPPYNTQTSGFLYKNQYQHSSWLSMMHSRIAASVPLLADDGSYLCHIDENEYEVLHLLFDEIGIPDAGTLVWDKKNPMLGRKGVATQHEYVTWRASIDSPIYLRSIGVSMILAKAREIMKAHGGVTEATRSEFSKWVSSNLELTGGERAYRLLDDHGRVYRGVAMGAPEPRTNPKFHIPLIHPITGKECPVPPNGWSRTPETLQKLMRKDEIIFGSDETAQPQKKVVLHEQSKRQISSVISDAHRGKADVLCMGLEFPYCHPVSLYEELMGAAAPERADVTLDYFAGSGTTAHAIINLNREDGGKRRYILVEMGEHLESVLLPRIKKVIYSKDWKNGKPVSREGSSHLLKYIRLESYEDTLNNLTLTRTPEQQLVLDAAAPEVREEYLLSYMLDLEASGSQSLLNLDAFRNPFAYKLKVSTGIVGETKTVNVDLVETFNYLIGLRVSHLDMIRGVRVVEGTSPAGERVLVLWRDVDEMDNDALDEWFGRQGYNTRDLEYDIIYVNGDNNLANLRRPDQTWKVRLIETDFHRLMFDGGDL